VLCWPCPQPDPDLSCAPTQPLRGEPSADARENDPEHPATVNVQGNEDRRFAPGSLSPSPPWSGSAQGWPAAKNPQRRGEWLTFAETLQRRSMTLRQLSAPALRSILRRWIGSLWGAPPDRPYSASDVLHALDYQPDGTPHLYAGPVRDPAGWLEHRLSFWIGPDGRPGPPHSARLADQAAEHAERQAAARAERQAAEAARRAPAAGHADHAAAAASRGAGLARQLAAARGGTFAEALARRSVPGW
jgi:hypothetical protein